VSRAPGHLTAIAKDLVDAALTRQFTSVEAWDHGWCVAEYRRSARAALSHDAERRVHLSAEGVEAFERGMYQLLRLRQGTGFSQPLHFSKEHAWQLVPLARANAHQIASTQFPSATSRNVSVPLCVPVNSGVAPGFRGVCDTVLTQF
jgi:hypothetical protein